MQDVIWNRTQWPCFAFLIHFSNTLQMEKRKRSMWEQENRLICNFILFQGQQPPIWVTQYLQGDEMAYSAFPPHCRSFTGDDGKTRILRQVSATWQQPQLKVHYTESLCKWFIITDEGMMFILRKKKQKICLTTYTVWYPLNRFMISVCYNTFHLCLRWLCVVLRVYVKMYLM